MISGPFARMVAECLCLVGACHADAVGLINELDRQCRVMDQAAVDRAVRPSR